MHEVLRGTAATAAEVLAWWAGLTLLWTVFISTPEPLDLTVGAACAVPAACAAHGARRAVAGR
ncbi:hypothetical protein GCM10010218_46150 [Streptomyces mashuensis]|uniref:Uncharacterized protein n=1 Tax=Streptomyces mashuensis TaxID=33904 RepID=A0A919B5F7_9ACTN|nr:hypothetical protein [Streptomyces mashuensis]GHF59408.1 hypothetical protein GCM10010218_46150 [Streptomyces mashuensis]